ncbi:MAG: HAMP domain-containing protein [Nitrospiraceae bacterium]|nr:MAG: HAMP domain-containing protein [Nitrospiraceae bacterium]
MAFLAGTINKIISEILPKRFNTIRIKLLVVAVAGLVLASIIYTIDSVRSEQAIMRKEIDKKVEVVTRLATNLGELPLLSRNPELMQRTLASLKNVADVSYAAFYDFDMNLLEQTGDTPLPVCDHPRKPDMSFVEGPHYIDLCAPVFSIRAGEDIGIFRDDAAMDTRDQVGWIRIGFSKAYLNEAQQSIILRGVLIALIFTFLSSLLVYKLTAAATKPLTLLSGAVQSVRDGRYPELSVSSGDEVGILTSEFNRMSRSISEREEMLVTRARLSSFVSDIGFVLTEGAPLRTTLQHCTEIIVTQIDSALVRIWTFDLEENAFVLQASSGIYTPADSPVSRLPADGSTLWTAAEQLQPQFANSVHILNAAEREWADKAGIVSFAIFPLAIESRLVGMLEIYSGRQLLNETFTTLDTVADQIAIGIQRKLAEQHIEASLVEKEVLLREIHHRVKNNMQVISSLLNFQTRYVNDKQFITILNESQNRIKSMALIHEKLYRSSDLANVDFNDYITNLSHDLFKFYGVDTDRITLKLDLQRIAFEIDTAIPCGLLVNELLTNSLKHAFPDGRRGEIHIILREKNADKGSHYEMTVSDNGIGIPADLDITKTKSLGLQLIHTLSEHQLQGRLDLDRSNGTTFHITFRKLKYKKRI